jgi:PAS domain S-box-containing protein
MGDKNRENLEKRIERSKAENKSLRELIASLKKESTDLKRSLREMAAFFNSMPTGVVLIQKGKILKMNRDLSEQLGYSSDDVIGCDFLDFIHQDQWAYVKRLHNIWDSGRLASDQYNAYLVTREGEAIDCEVKVRRIRYRGRRSFLLTLNRMEKRKEEEKEKIEAKKRDALNTLLSGLTREFGAYNDSLLNKIKDLKNRILNEDNNIEQALNILGEASLESLNIAHQLEMIEGSERDQKDMVPFDLNDIVREAVEAVKMGWKEVPEHRNVIIDLRTYLRASSFAKGNPKEIMNVIVYMLTNSVEAMSPDGGDIHITTEENAGYIHVYIQDSGEGVPAEYGDRIFDPFFTSKGEGSTGLGLSLSNAIIKRHGGEIEMSSMHGQWTLFHVKLPLAKGIHETRHKVDRKKIKDAQILIIQEEDIARELLSHLLSSKGCKVDTANNILEGLGKIKRQKYNLVISDIEASPSDMTFLVKKFEKIDPKMSIALIRGNEDGKDIGLPDEHGVDLTLRKPLDVNMVVRQVSELLMKI